MKDKSKKKVPTAPTVKKEVSEEELKKISGGQGYNVPIARPSSYRPSTSGKPAGRGHYY